MERLTAKYNDVEEGIIYDLAPHNFSDDLSTHNAQCEVAINRVINKLGQLEDVEDELGIDLITLFSALKNGVWYKDYKDSDSIKFTKDIEEHINWKELIVPAKYTHISLSFKDYGKTWALTEEELQ